MGKKKVCICVVMLLVIVAIGFFGFYVWNTSTLLSEARISVKQAGMRASKVGFTLDQAEEVKITVKSSIEEGDAVITLQKENGDILYTFKTDCSQKEKISLEAGNYNICIDSEKFKGNYEVVVRK